MIGKIVLELVKGTQLNSMDAVLAIQVLCILFLVIKSRKGDTENGKVGIRWIGILSLATLLARLIVYFGDKLW